jgi:hypothetical protein
VIGVTIFLCIFSFIMGMIVLLFIMDSSLFRRIWPFKKKKTLQEMKDYYEVYDKKCHKVNTLSDGIFREWINLEVELNKAKKEERIRNTDSKGIRNIGSIICNHSKVIGSYCEKCGISVDSK